MLSAAWVGFFDELEKIAMGSDLDPSIRARTIPTLKDVQTVVNIQSHDAAGAGHHYDLRIKDPKKQITYSWALPKAELPDKGKRRLAVRQPDHAATYLGYEGDLETKAGKGSVENKMLTDAHIHSANPGRVHFSLEGRDYLLHRTSSNKNWLIRGL